MNWALPGSYGFNLHVSQSVHFTGNGIFFATSGILHKSGLINHLGCSLHTESLNNNENENLLPLLLGCLFFQLDFNDDDFSWFTVYFILSFVIFVCVCFFLFGSASFINHHFCGLWKMCCLSNHFFHLPFWFKFLCKNKNNPKTSSHFFLMFGDNRRNTYKMYRIYFGQTFCCFARQ